MTFRKSLHIESLDIKRYCVDESHVKSYFP